MAGEGERAYVVPALHEEPPHRLRILVAVGHIVEAVQDLGLGPVDLDVPGGGAVGWAVGVGGADVGHFEHHVGFAAFFPEGDAYVLHAVS